VSGSSFDLGALCSGAQAETSALSSPDQKLLASPVVEAWAVCFTSCGILREGPAARLETGVNLIEPAEAPWDMAIIFDAIYAVARARGIEVEF